MVWHLIRYLVSFSIPAFYKKIRGKNIHHIHAKGPVIIAMNHPNAFMDPVCITWVSYPARVKYIARGDAFKPGLASFLLGRIGIVPIFRLRDGGREGLQKNDESYKIVNNLLKKNAKIIIFAEGLCIQERRLRPLKKGVSRMVFGAYEFLQNKDLVVLPIGVNYSSPSKLRSKLFYNVGTPIKVSDFEAQYKENQARTNNQFLQLLQTKMKDLVTHINNKDNDVLVPQLETMVMKEWLKLLQLTDELENEFTVTKHLTEIINNIDETEPEKLAVLKEKTSIYFKLLQKNKLKDWVINPLNSHLITRTNFTFRCILLVLGLPFHLIGYLAAYLPYKLTERTTKKVVKGNKEFYASIILGFGTFIFLFNFLIWFFAIYSFSESIILPLLATAGLMLCARFALVFHFFILKTKGIKRALYNPAIFNDLKAKRKEIMDIMNGLTNF